MIPHYLGLLQPFFTDSRQNFPLYRVRIHLSADEEQNFATYRALVKVKQAAEILSRLVLPAWQRRFPVVPPGPSLIPPRSSVVGSVEARPSCYAMMMVMEAFPSSTTRKRRNGRLISELPPRSSVAKVVRKSAAESVTTTNTLDQGKKFSLSYLERIFFWQNRANITGAASSSGDFGTEATRQNCFL